MKWKSHAHKNTNTDAYTSARTHIRLVTANPPITGLFWFKIFAGRNKIEQNYQKIFLLAKEKNWLAKINTWPFFFLKLIFFSFFLPSLANKLGEFFLALLDRFFVFAPRTGKPYPSVRHIRQQTKHLQWKKGHLSTVILKCNIRLLSQI